MTRAGPRRGTAVSLRGAARVEAILDEATRLLVSEGDGGLALRRVAVGAGIALGNLQYYFPTQESLLRALLARVFTRARARLAAVLGSDAGDLRGILDLLLDEHADRNACRLFYELWALAARERWASRVLRAFYDAYVDAVVEAVRAQSPGLAPDVARSRARMFVAAIEGLSLFRSGAAGESDPAFDADAARWLLQTLVPDDAARLSARRDGRAARRGP